MQNNMKCTNGLYKYTSECILLTKTTAAQNEGALSYHKVRGLHFLAVVFVRRIVGIYKHTLQ